MFGIGIGFFVLFILFGCGICTLIVVVIYRSVRTRTPDEVKSEKFSMQEQVRAMVPSLAPWKDATQITAAMLFQWSKGTSNTLTGKIYSEERTPIIAFDRVERGFAANGWMFAASTAFELYFEIRVDEFTIMYNREWLGHVNRQGYILNTRQEIIGQAVHPPKVSFNAGPFYFRTGDNKFPLYMNGRVLATIWVSPNYSDAMGGGLSILFNENNWGQSIIELHDRPTPEEEKWLCAFGTLEVAFHGHWLI
jgi:hypothetical protein